MDDYGQDTSGERPANRHPLGLTGAVAALADTLFPATSLSSSLAQDFSPGTPALLRVGLLHPALATVAACYVMWVIFEKLNRAKPTLTIRHRSFAISILINDVISVTWRA
jgi:cytochrome c oxidase assembly protein subunit 15